MPDYTAFEEARIKHLEMIQAVIGRLGNDSFLIKGWAVTVTAAFLGFAVNLDKGGMAFASALPTLLFWGLDSYYLWSERMFRALYDLVRRRSDAVDPFFMGATTGAFAAEAPVDSIRKVFLSKTLWRFYCSVLVGAGVIGAILCFD